MGVCVCVSVSLSVYTAPSFPWLLRKWLSLILISAAQQGWARPFINTHLCYRPPASPSWTPCRWNWRHTGLGASPGSWGQGSTGASERTCSVSSSLTSSRRSYSRPWLGVCSWHLLNLGLPLPSLPSRASLVGTAHSLFPHRVLRLLFMSPDTWSPLVSG